MTLGVGQVRIAASTAQLTIARPQHVRLRPGRWLFLAGAARSAIVGVVLLIDIVMGVASPWWAVVLLLLLLPTTGAIAKHRFFAPAAEE